MYVYKWQKKRLWSNWCNNSNKNIAGIQGVNIKLRVLMEELI